MPPPPQLRFVARPHQLPEPPATGRIVMLDIAFAHDPGWERSTLPFIESVGDRLALWVDHHDHRVWPDFADDPRFVLVSKQQARACPQLIDPELVARIGPVEHVWAHADVDGCIAAAKFLRGGVAPYAEADEDARYADAPGKGFACSAAGQRLCLAVDEASESLRSKPFKRLLEQIAWSLVEGAESRDLSERLDDFADAQRRHRQTLAPLIDAATMPAPSILLVEVAGELGGARKKHVLRALEQKAVVAIVAEGTHLTVATFHDESLDLSAVPGLRGQQGYAWGSAPLDEVVAAVARQIARRGPAAR